MSLLGLFLLWLNVKTNFGAVGDGVTDDTIAFEYALNALASPTSHANVLYIPAGTYKITSSLDFISTNCNMYCTGKSIIGESPANTILKWQGDATGSAMLTLDGINRMQFDRLTLDGSGAEITLVNETMHQGCCYDGSNEYSDDVFENAAVGIQAGDNSAGCCSAETKVDRDTFANMTKAGISLEDWNALDWYVRYSTFEHDHYGVTNIYGAGGAVHLDHNLFEYNDTDAGWGNGSTQSYTYNTSYYSGVFLVGSPFGNTSILIGNTILMPQTVAISMPGDWSPDSHRQYHRGDHYGGAKQQPSSHFCGWLHIDPQFLCHLHGQYLCFRYPILGSERHVWHRCNKWRPHLDQ